MGVKERKERDKLEMRDRILEAAGRLFVRDGFEQTSIRKIARDIEYSAGTIYLYFPGGKDELFYTIHEQGFSEFGKQMRALDHIKHPIERLKALGKTYLKFAFDNPEYYNLMFIETAPMETEETEENWEAGMKTYSCLQDTVQQCIDQGYFGDKELHPTTFFIWSTMHGMVALALRKRLKMYPEESLMPMMEQVSNDLCDQLRVD